MLALPLLLVIGTLGAEPEAMLLNFTQANCGHCRAMEPVLAQLEATGLPVQSINVEQHPEMVQRFKVAGTPTFIVLVAGRETGRQVGTASVEKLQSLFPQSSAATDVRGQSPEGNQIGQSLGGLFGKGAKPASPPGNSAPPGGDPFTQRQPGASGHIDPGFADRAAPPTEPAGNEVDPRGRAMASAVRLKVRDAEGQSVGTGTIIDTHGDEAVLITCGHIFRASQGKGQIQVDLFHPQPRTIAGKLLDYDLERDIALVSISPGAGTVAAVVAPEGLVLNKNDEAFNIGCNQGEDPSLRPTKITGINRYQGPPNIESAGHPVNGRSGGGLFSREGYLIGVCNFADEAGNEGVYAAMGTIHWQLARVGLTELYQPQVVAAAEVATPEQRGYEPSTPAPSTGSLATADANTAGDTEIICIVRSKSNPSAKGQVLVIDRASQQLMQQLAAASLDPTAAADLALQADLRSSAVAAPRNMGPVVRGQSRH